MSLEVCQQEILDLYGRLKREDKYYHRFAYPFLSVKPEGYAPKRIPSVLLVGKATKHDWDQKDWCPRSKRLDETRDFLDRIKQGKDGSGFWSFAKKLSSQLNDATGSTIDFFQNLVWTNIAKLGVVDGNPEGNYFRLQRDIAIATLKAEIAEYAPSVIVFVTADYQRDVLFEIAAPESEWRQMNDQQYWWLDSRDEQPPILWTEHPQGKRQQLWDSWSKKAGELILPVRV